MSMHCACYVCSGTLGASKRLQEALGKAKRTTARNFDSPAQANTFSIELSKRLRARGVELDDWRKVGNRHWFGLYPKGISLRVQITRALSELGYAPWLHNKKVFTHNKFGWPLLVTDSEIVLLGQSVPRWGRISTALKSEIQGKPTFTDKQPLGFLGFTAAGDSVQSLAKILKGLGFVNERTGLLVSVEDDLEIEYTKGEGRISGKLQQPESELLLDERKFDNERKAPPVVVPKPEVPVVRPAPEAPRQPQDILTQPDKILLKKDNTEVPHIAIPIKLGEFYSKTGGTAGSQGGLLWMRNLWTFLNENKFGGQLKMPNISYIKNVARMRTRGYWRASTRELKIAPKLFNAPLPVFVEIFLHEMCHSAVSEIDRVVDNTEQGHGHHWKNWMRKVGLNPARYDHNNADIYLSEEEQVKVKEQREKAEENKIELALTPEWNLTPGRVVRIALERGSKVVNGVIAYKQTSKYAVIVDPNSNQWWNVPPQLIYKADPNADNSQYSSDAWQSAIRQVQFHFQYKKEVRQVKKSRRFTIGY